MIKSMGVQHTGQKNQVMEFCRNPGTCNTHMTCDLLIIYHHVLSKWIEGWQNKHWWKEGNLIEHTLFISKERGFPGGSDRKESACNTEDSGSILGWRRSPGQGTGYSFQSSCLENSMDRSLAGCSPWGHKESDTIERLKIKKQTRVSMWLFIYVFAYISAGDSRILHKNILKYSLRP